MVIKEKVKIGAMTYDVIKTNEVIVLDNQVCNGVIDHEDLVIKISTDRSEQRQEETFIHELLHGIIRERNVILENEEMIVDEISKGLYQVIKDNSDTFR